MEILELNWPDMLSTAEGHELLIKLTIIFVLGLLTLGTSSRIFLRRGLTRPGKLWHFKHADIIFTSLNHAIFST